MNFARSFVSPALLLACFAVNHGSAADTSDTGITRGITYAEVDGKPLQLDLYMPPSVKNPPLVVFMHGGSWRAGSRADCPMKWITARGYAIASVDYRLSQVAPFPAQIHDCKGAVRWLRAHAVEYGYDAARIAAAGASAGGHLAALLGTSGGEKELEGTVGGNLDQSSRVQAVVDFYGASDFILRQKDQPKFTNEPTGNVFQLLGHAVSADPESAKVASPVFHITSDDPPLLDIHGSNDPQVLPNQAQRLCDGYRAAGLDATLHYVEGAKHGGKEFDAPAIQALAGEFLDRHLKTAK